MITLEGWNKKDRYNEESQGIYDYFENSFDNIVDSPTSYHKNVLANLFDNLNKPFENSSKYINKDSKQIITEKVGKFRSRKKIIKSFVEENNEKELYHPPSSSLTNYISFKTELPILSSVKECADLKISINEVSPPRYMKSLERQPLEIKETNKTKLSRSSFEIANIKNRIGTPDFNPLYLIQAPITEELRHHIINVNTDSKSMNIEYSKQLLADFYKLPKIQQELISNGSRKITSNNKSNQEKSPNNNSLFNSIIRNINNTNGLFLFQNLKRIKKLDNIQKDISHPYSPIQHTLIKKEFAPYIESIKQIEENNIKSHISISKSPYNFNYPLSKSTEQTKDIPFEKVKYTSRRSSTEYELQNLYEKDIKKFIKIPSENEKQKQLIDKYEEEFLNTSKINFDSSPQNIENIFFRSNKMQSNYPEKIFPKLKDLNDVRLLSNEVKIL